jgi:hypothetical protein
MPGFVCPPTDSGGKTRDRAAKITAEHRANSPKNKFRAQSTLISKGLKHFCLCRLSVGFHKKPRSMQTATVQAQCPLMIAVKNTFAASHR